MCAGVNSRGNRIRRYCLQTSDTLLLICSQPFFTSQQFWLGAHRMCLWTNCHELPRGYAPGTGLSWHALHPRIVSYTGAPGKMQRIQCRGQTTGSNYLL